MTEFHVPSSERRVFAVELPWQTLWAWETRDGASGAVRRSGQLFTDYVSCVCDAQRQNQL
jgi:hypothetical protein